MIMGLIWKVKIKEYKRDYYINPRAYYISCGCHNLNLVLGDMANSCTRVVFFFFGVLQPHLRNLEIFLFTYLVPLYYQTAIFLILSKLILRNLRFIFFMRNIHVTRVQSLINNTNHLAPYIVEVVIGPHTSEWTRSKGLRLLLLLRKNVARWCYANWQISQWKE